MDAPDKNLHKKAVTIECEYSRFEDTITKLKEMGSTFITLSTIREENDRICLVYYFEDTDRMIVLKLKLKENTVPSLYSTFQKADFIEREINNLFGVKFLGHPNLERIKAGEDDGEDTIYEI